MTHSLRKIFPPKIKITKSHGQILIDVNGNNELLQGDHLINFNLMGFEENQTGYNKLTNDYESAVKQVMKYLLKYDFELHSDSEVSQTISKIQMSENLLESSKDIGTKIKKEKSFSLIKPPHFADYLELKPYQIKPITHMIEIPNAANFSIPGAGKTIMTYAAYDALKSRGIVDQLLVVGPLASFRPWEDEFKFCFNTDPSKNILRYVGQDRFKKTNNLKNFEVILTSYGTASNDSDILRREIFDNRKVMMVIDESHHIKSFQEKALHANAMIELGKHATRRYILTGTPMPRDWDDLWSQITFLWPHNRILGTRSAYKSMMEKFDRDSHISEKINFLWTRITNLQMKNDLPKVIPEVKTVPMSPIQQEIYIAIENEFASIDQKDISQIIDVQEWKKNKILRLLQTVSNPFVLTDRDIEFGLDSYQSDNTDISNMVKNYKEIPNKVKEAANIARAEAKKGNNVIIWTVFVKNVDFLCKVLEDMNPIGISGEIPIDSDDEKEIVGREERLDYFKTNKGQILVSTVGSIAESVSLHKTCQCAIYLERSFNAGQYMQSLNRIYRIGSDIKIPIKYYFLSSVFHDSRTETIDHVIDGRLKERVDRMHKLLNDEFHIRPLSLETSNYKIKNRAQYYGEDDDPEQIMKKVKEMIDKHKKTHKI